MLQSERDKIAHLLRRFGLGASEAELAHYGKNGLSGAMDLLLDYEGVDEGFGVPITAFTNPQNNALNPRALQSWWVLRLLVTQRPLQEKMTLFWHDHFATSGAKVDVPYVMYRQNETFRVNATGRFQDILTAASKDPAMVYWLDNQDNVKGRPNENFAREVMELFTLGIGNYTEKDIQEAARAFTGWSYGTPLRRRGQPPKPGPRAEFVFRREDHDDGQKSVLGNTGAFDGDDVLGILCGNPQTARYITLKLWEWFAYPNPDEALVNRLADRFRSNGLKVSGLLRDIMESPEFYSEKAVRKIYKNPVDFCIASARALGIGQSIAETMREQATEDNAQQRLRGTAPLAAIALALKAMGMELFFPPDVAGWDGGAAWISSATMVERIKWADKLFGPLQRQPGGRGVSSVGYPAYALFTDDPSPKGVAQKLCSVFDCPLPPSKLAHVEAAVRDVAGGAVTPQNANPAAAAASRLIFGSPEFQFC